MDQGAFQDAIPWNHLNPCWGCGSTNEQGLQIKSYWSGDETICTWRPKEYHAAGVAHFLNGGIIASLIDCHSLCTAMMAVYRKEGREWNTEPLPWYITGSLQVVYLMPTPISEAVRLRAHVKAMKERKMIVSCSLFSSDQECARGELVAVRFTPNT